MTRMQPLIPEVMQKVAELYQGGMSIAAVSKATGESRRQVIRMLDASNIPTARTQPETKAQQVRELEHLNLTPREVAERLDISQDYVRKLCRWYGIKLRHGKQGVPLVLQEEAVQAQVQAPKQQQQYDTTPSPVAAALRGFGMGW